MTTCSRMDSWITKCSNTKLRLFLATIWVINLMIKPEIWVQRLKFCFTSKAFVILRSDPVGWWSWKRNKKLSIWPAVKKVVDRYELVEGTGIQTAADLNVVSSQQPHRRSVLLHKHLPLQRRAEQQEVVVCRETRENGINTTKVVRICVFIYLFGILVYC